ncbi:hypothetical protein SAMN04487865_100851 [Succinivibrio dextrinosolvens]|uniref:Toxin YoeB n=1 Tax=Succinivibrio dextrinosolvens TaxID=83771 RepID=A0A662Z9J9_9GAMM|nr:hypothetical protein SAMN04487865_100851 [Succinivibrio dextrinosolvens]
MRKIWHDAAWEEYLNWQSVDNKIGNQVSVTENIRFLSAHIIFIQKELCVPNIYKIHSYSFLIFPFQNFIQSNKSQKTH